MAPGVLKLIWHVQPSLLRPSLLVLRNHFVYAFRVYPKAVGHVPLTFRRFCRERFAFLGLTSLEEFLSRF